MAPVDITFWTLDTTAWTAIQGIGTCLTAVVAAIAAWFALGQLRATTEVRIDEARPYVIADFEESPASRQFVDFSLRNVGQTPALNVSLTWDQMPQEARPERNYKFSDARMFREPIPTLAPGRELRIFFDSHLERGAVTDRVLPDRYELTIKYDSSPAVGNRHYDEHFVLDLLPTKGGTFLQIYGIHDAAVALRALADTVKKSGIVNEPLDVRVETRAENVARTGAERRSLNPRVQRRVREATRYRTPPKRRGSTLDGP
jgi:hypothetical protein